MQVLLGTGHKMAEKEDVSEPEVPRRKKVPRRVDYGAGVSATTPEGHYRQLYFEAFNLIISCITSRFDQQGFKVYRNVQDLLLKAVNNEDCHIEFDFVTIFYGSDFHREILKTQLTVLSSNFKDRNAMLSDVIKFFKALSSAQQDLLSEVCTFAQTQACYPCYQRSERSFSALRRVKSYLHSTMTQSRLIFWYSTYIESSLTN